MATPHETFQHMLKEQGYSITKARLKVFNALLHQEPMPMATLVERSGGVDRASVYRAVELFERLGIVQRINIGWKYRLELSDRFTGHHHHLTCLTCGKTIPMNEDALEAALERLVSAHGFTASAHQIEIQGYCAACRQKRAG